VGCFHYSGRVTSSQQPQAPSPQPAGGRGCDYPLCGCQRLPVAAGFPYSSADVSPSVSLFHLWFIFISTLYLRHGVVAVATSIQFCSLSRLLSTPLYATLRFSWVFLSVVRCPLVYVPGIPRCTLGPMDPSFSICDSVPLTPAASSYFAYFCSLCLGGLSRTCSSSLHINQWRPMPLLVVES
jgi:hypothetical protein